MEIKKLAIITTHPIQYYAPLFRLLAQSASVTLKVFYTSGIPKESQYEKDFGTSVSWDIPLLEGYEYYFSENVAKNPGTTHFKGIINPHLIEEISIWKPSAILIFGWNYYSHIKIMRYFKGKIPVWFRGDSTLLDYDIKTIRDILSVKSQCSKNNIIKLLTHNILSFLRYKIRITFLHFIYKNIDKALFVGMANKEYFLACGLNDSQLIFTPHSVDNERFIDSPDRNYKIKALEWRKNLGIQDDDFVFLFTGKFIEKKNPSLLIDSFNELIRLHINKKLHLILVGSGPLERILFEKAGQNESIHFIPFQNQSVMPIIYRLGNIFVMPSKGPGETWGLAANEALACNIPIIVSNKCGCYKDLVNNTTGYIYNSNIDGNLVELMGKSINFKGEYFDTILNKFSYQAILKAVINQLNLMD